MAKDNKQAAIDELSIRLNSVGAHKIMQDVDVIHFHKEISNDDPVWHEIEKMIIKKLKKVEA